MDERRDVITFPAQAIDWASGLSGKWPNDFQNTAEGLFRHTDMPPRHSMLSPMPTGSMETSSTPLIVTSRRTMTSTLVGRPPSPDGRIRCSTSGRPSILTQRVVTKTPSQGWPRAGRISPVGGGEGKCLSVDDESCDGEEGSFEDELLGLIEGGVLALESVAHSVANLLAVFAANAPVVPRANVAVDSSSGMMSPSPQCPPAF